MPTSTSSAGSATTLVATEAPATTSSRSASAHLRPEDAYSSFAGLSRQSPPRKSRKSSPLGRSDTITASNSGATAGGRTRARGEKRRTRDGPGTRRRGTWKKLLWVKQAYPDNYTDEQQFLSHLQRNPRLRPYEFWPLVADSTIIVQHVASVLIFICCFVGIFQERVSPVAVVSWATSGTVLGWVLRDIWISREDAQQLAEHASQSQDDDTLVQSEQQSESELMVPSIETMHRGSTTSLLGSDSLGISFANTTATTSRATSTGDLSTLAARSIASPPTSPSPAQSLTPPASPPSSTYDPLPRQAYQHPSTTLSPRNAERLATAKSAILIYCALLGLSPILKSLTKSTSPDSIWAMSSWLIIINVFTFDYGAGVEAKFPAPLSTNAALMASTVLASRLPSTTHVFSLTLFSIEVFGLFPVFRRHLRHVSREGHWVLTGALSVAAGAGLCVTITGGGWKAAVLGTVLGPGLAGLAMGMTSWWLIGLQRYKNEIRGPWDPARPVIRRRWD